MSYTRLAHFSPGRVIISSIFMTIIIGTALLALPFARTQDVALLDLFFTATSATCVTGLMTIPLESFTTFGYTIIMILTQIGGLGLITLTMFLMSLFVDFGFTTQIIAGKLLDIESWPNIKKFLLFIIGATLVIELLGALSLFTVLHQHYPLGQALFLSVFHSITSFCNAGINLIDTNTQAHLANSNVILITSMLLMLFGGLGFVTLHELVAYAQSFREKRRHKFSLHSKIVLFATVLIILISTLTIFCLEWNNTLAPFSPFQKIVHSLFHAISFRSGGLLIIDITQLALPTLLFAMLIAFVGNAHGSTGSGIKITTMVIFIATVKAAILGRSEVEIWGRRIAQDQMYKAVAIISLSTFWVLLTTFLLLILEPAHSFIAIIFEAISAFANLGLTLNVTETLSVLGKIVIIMSMIIGRIGSLTLILTIKEFSRQHNEATRISYPEERVILG